MEDIEHINKKSNEDVFADRLARIFLMQIEEDEKAQDDKRKSPKRIQRDI